MKQKLYWAGHIAKNAPGLALDALPLALAGRTYAPPPPLKIIVGTHHKALTVFLSRVFRVFAAITNRSYDVSVGERMDYSKTVLIDHHSRIDWDKVTSDYVGLHVMRDPRDLVVSSVHYHKTSEEKWLHVPHDKFDGKTYHEWINALPNLEEQLLFEINDASATNIKDMLDWEYNRPGIVEFRYDDLIGDGASDRFRKAIADWPLKKREINLLVGLFRYFALGGPGTSAKHIRNPKSGQWRKHFTPRVQAEFDKVFPDALSRLGLEE